MTLLILQVVDTASCGKRPPRLGGSKIWSGNHNEQRDSSHTRNKIL